MTEGVKYRWGLRLSLKDVAEYLGLSYSKVKRDFQSRGLDRRKFSDILEYIEDEDPQLCCPHCGGALEVRVVDEDSKS